MDINWESIEVPCDLERWRSRDYDVEFPKHGYLYVIELPETYAIKYPLGVSTVCYIGRQGPRIAGTRLHSHANGWISKFQFLTRETKPFIIHFATPIKNRSESYKVLEAQLISAFKEKFGGRPQFNRNIGIRNQESDLNLDCELFRKRRLKARISYVPFAKMLSENDE